MSALDRLREFHSFYGVPVRYGPTTDVPKEERDLRARLIREEAEELIAAAERGDVVEVLDGLCDLLYVTYGTALTYGMGAVLKEAFAEVHRSNMTKYDNPPRIREDGKVLKGPNYSPPDLQRILIGASLGDPQ